MEPIMTDTTDVGTARIRPHDVGLGVSDADTLTIDGHSLTDLVRQYGAPLWIMSADTIRHNLRTITEAFQAVTPASRIVYASKANPAPAISALVVQEGAMVDVASLGHAVLAERAGVPARRIVVNGNCKSAEYLRWAIDADVAMINVDSIDELNQTIATPLPRDSEVRIALRLTTDLSRHHDDRGMFDSELETKFGMSDQDALHAADLIARTPGIRLVGLHHHLGFTAYDSTYNAELDLQRRRRVVEQLVAVADKLYRGYGVSIEVFNYGGGFRVKTDTGYGPGAVRSLPEIDAGADATAGYTGRLLAERGLPAAQIWVEPGGYLVSNAGVFTARVGVRKSIPVRGEVRDWVFLEDTSAYHFVRRLMADVYHPAIAATRMSQPCTGRVHVAGATCAPDEVTPPLTMPELTRGDLIALLDQGAYCDAVSTEYCALPLPPTVLVDEHSTRLIRRRRTPHDIAADYLADVEPAGGTRE
ncbi:alanine racemase [Micromonospora sp. NPDC047707]|uniref:diaminopimelate decarboxylase family protein n=1 Tax=Micromonospora sp. NPDC047707 TaxID=3154498 RepID=UPI00345318BD